MMNLNVAEINREIADCVTPSEQITHPCCRKCVSLQRDLDSVNRRVSELESKLAMRELLGKVDD